MLIQPDRQPVGMTQPTVEGVEPDPEGVSEFSNHSALPPFVYTRGMHYNVTMRSKFTPGQLEASFWIRVNKTETCWLWTAGRHRDGYGQTSRGKKAHRVAYEFVKGPIPEGLEIDHLCRVRLCVNPDHLEAVTHKVNMQRAPWETPSRKRSYPMCAHSDGPFVTYRSGRTVCRSCENARLRDFFARKRVSSS